MYILCQWIIFVYRHHPELREDWSIQNNVSDIVIDEEEPMDDNDQVDMISNEENNQTQNMVEEENVDTEKDFFEEKHEIFVELLTKIMETKVEHSVANIAIDEILQAFQDASKKSNALLKEQIREVIDSKNRKLPKIA
jgi:hypothetical protein